MIKKLLLAFVLLAAPVAFAQQQSILCSGSTACDPTTGPSNTGTGDPLWKAYGKTNADFTQLFSMFGANGLLVGHGAAPNALTAASATNVISLFSGTQDASHCLSGVATLVTCTGGTVTSVGLTSTDFAVSGTPVTTSGNITANLNTTAVTAGSYTSANITVDSKGRITAASNGSGGSGVSATGTPANGNLTKWSGASSVTNGDLSGDVTTSGTLATTVVKVNGGSLPVSANLVGTNSSGQVIQWPGETFRTVSGTTDTVLSSDCSNGIYYTSASAVAVSLPTAGGTGFGSSCSIDIQVTGAGTATVTPVSGTINGSAKLPIATGRGCTAFNNASSWGVMPGCTALISGGSGNVSNTGTPTNGQMAQWTNATTIQGVAVTGSGNAVLATSPTLTTPNLGTPSAATLTNATGLPVGGIAAIAANSIVANATGGSAIPTALAVAPLRLLALQANTKFTAAGTGCTVGTTTGGAFGGTFVLATGPCTSVAITMNGATGFTATGYHCDVGDRTTQAAGTWIPAWIESASTTTTATIPIPSAAGATDTISFQCSPN